MFNIYWIEDGEQASARNLNLTGTLALARGILNDGHEITGIINSEEDN